MTETQYFKITEAARMAGVSPSTLRLWELQKLVEPLRTATGHRLYDSQLVERLKEIAWLRSEKGLNHAAIRVNLGEGQASADGFGPVETPESTSIGSRVRRLRRHRGLTLEAMSTAMGSSVSSLSTFERTSQGLSLSALHALANCLDTTIAELNGEQATGQGESLVRQHSWRSWPATSSGVTIQMLADGRRQMECHRFVLARGASSEGDYQHIGEEFIHVLSGSLEIVLDGDRFFNLNTGDSFYFESRRPHSWCNTADGETILLWINTPPTF